MMIRILALSLCLCSPSALAGTTINLVHVYDGDSFRVNVDGWPEVVGKDIAVRLKGADSPNLKGQCEKERRLAKEALDFTWKFLGDAKHVELIDVERDHYFRLLAKVQADGKDLSTSLIAAGLAKPYEGGEITNWCTETDRIVDASIAS